MNKKEKRQLNRMRSHEQIYERYKELHKCRTFGCDNEPYIKRHAYCFDCIRKQMRKHKSK